MNPLRWALVLGAVLAVVGFVVSLLVLGTGGRNLVYALLVAFGGFCTGVAAGLLASAARTLYRDGSGSDTP